MISIFWIGTFVMLFLSAALILLAIFYQKNLHQFKMKESELLLKASLESEKAERQRMALELHDGLQGDLNAIKNFIVISGKIDDKEQRQDMLQETRLALETAIESTRLLSQKLMPPLLEEGNFIGAIKNYFGTLQKSTGKSFSIKADAPALEIPKETGYELYRVVQEFCNNILKHGNVNALQLILRHDQDFIDLELIDDSTPYNFKECYQRSSGSGLRNIQSRIKMLQAELVQCEVLSGNHFIIKIKVLP